MKETFYFSHDYNARDDEKIMNMLSEMGIEGYGLYWTIIETLAQNNGKIELDSIKGLGYKLRCDNTLITQLLHNYNLFIIDEKEGVFYNKRLLTHLDKREESKQRKSEAGKKGMAKRWGKNNTTITPVITKDNTTITNDNKVKESKVKKNKVKENKDNIKIEKSLTTKVVLNLENLIRDKINKDTFINSYNMNEKDLVKEMNNFYLYWSEKKPNGKKELWEMQKTFDVSRRFNKWLDNNDKWNKNNFTTKKPNIGITRI